MNISMEFLKEHFLYCNGFLYWKKLPNKKGRAKVGEIAGGKHPLGYWTIGINGQRYYAHRLIWTYHHGTTPDMIDHINYDRSDSRIENLRACTKSENMRNQGASKSNTSGIKGVGWSEGHQRWRAYINSEGKTLHLGYFKDFDAAKQAVTEKRAELHGAFARN